MDYKSIDEIYAANHAFREAFAQTIGGVEPEEQKSRPADEKWSIEQIVEHISMVDEGMSRICGKLLAEAQKAGLKGGVVAISDVFRNYTQGESEVKLEAPERVVPTGERSVVRIAAQNNAITVAKIGVCAEHDTSKDRKREL